MYRSVQALFDRTHFAVLVALLCISLFTAPVFAGTATLLAPADGVRIDDTLVQFRWTPVSDADVYYVYVGTGQGGKNTYDSGEITTTSVAVNVPSNGSYYVRLWTKCTGKWTYMDSTFSTGVGPARLSTPVDGATGVDPVAQFSWNSVTDAQAYYLYVGTSPGTQDVYGTGEIAVTSAEVSTLQPQTYYYARLWTKKTAGNWVWSDTTFTTGSGIARLVFPRNSATDVDPRAVFSWNAVSDALAYYLYVGTTPGAQDVYGTGEITTLTTTVPNLQVNTNYFARLWTKKTDSWSYLDSTFATGTGLAHLTNPGNGAVHVNTNVTFSWTPVPDVDAYYLYVGSSVGAKDIVDTGETRSLTFSGATLEANQTYYARLWTKKGGRWFYEDSKFHTDEDAANLVYPLSGATDIDPSLTFSWKAIPGADKYYLYVGSGVGLNDAVNSGEITSTSLQIGWLHPNTHYCVRLWTVRNGVWTYTDSTFSTGTGGARLVYPSEGTSDTDPFRPFTWNMKENADLYYLQIGTAPGATDVFETGNMPATMSETFVAGLLPNLSYYARLWTWKNGIWVYDDSTFHTGAQQLFYADSYGYHDAVLQLTAQVRQMADTGNVPFADTLLAAQVAVTHKTIAYCSDFAQTLMQLLARNRIVSRPVALTLLGNYHSWHEIVEYFDPYTETWVVTDPTNGIMYFDQTYGRGQSAKELNAFVKSEAWGAIKPEFVTSLGDYYPRINATDPTVLFLNLIPTGGTPQSIELNSPANLLQLTAPSQAGADGEFVFYFRDLAASVALQRADGTTLVAQPVEGTNWSDMLWFDQGWSISESVPDGVDLYRIRRILF